MFFLSTDCSKTNQILIFVVVEKASGSSIELPVHCLKNQLGILYGSATGFSIPSHLSMLLAFLQDYTVFSRVILQNWVYYLILFHNHFNQVPLPFHIFCINLSSCKNILLGLERICKNFIYQFQETC